MKPMKVEPIEGEGNCFWVGSRSRMGLDHRVDLKYQESPTSKPVEKCGCERSLIYNETCAHILAVHEYLKQLGMK